jgi:hypothetical protein
MYSFTLRHRIELGANILNPEKITKGYLWTADKATLFPIYSYTERIKVSPSTYYQVRGETEDAIVRYVDYYDFEGNFVEDFDTGFLFDSFLVPSGCYEAIVTIKSDQNPFLVSITKFLDSEFTPYFTSRVLSPVYKSLSIVTEKQSGYEFYRRALDGNLKFLKQDYDYINALEFDARMLLDITDSDGNIEPFTGEFYKTDCKWDDDDRIVEVKTEPSDDYTQILSGLDKVFDLVQEAPELEEVIARRRPLIQVYIPGDLVITNFLGGTFWEQEIQIDPEFDNNQLVNHYRFFNSKNIRVLPAAYAASLSTDVTGEYDSSRVNLNGLYYIDEDTSTYFGFVRYRFTIKRVSDDFAMYQTPWTDFRQPSINDVLFTGINGETGSFYFTEYRIYVRYYTDLLEVRGTNTFPIPSEDIVANNNNYKRVIGYDVDDFSIYDETVPYPTKFGRLPEDTPDAGKYYKELRVSAITGLSNPLPVSSSNWKAVSLWFFNTDSIRLTELQDGMDFTFRDCFPLHSVIQILLRKIGSNVVFNNIPEHSKFLYDAVNPLGGFDYLDFDSVIIDYDYAGNLKHYITPKSNVLVGDYDQAAKKGEISLSQVLNILRDVYRCFWHVQDGRLIIEHVVYYQNGGTYSLTPVLGTDLTQLNQPKNNRNWGYLQNRWEYDKESMPERFQFSWMDDVSLPFKGNAIEIISRYVQQGRSEDVTVNAITTDIDFIMANPQGISKDGFCLMAAVEVDGINRIPFIEYDLGYNSKVIMQNGFLSWLYLQPKFYVYDLPSDKVVINKEQENLAFNVSRKKKQEVVFPSIGTIDPYKLIKTSLGDGIIEKMSLNMESLMVKATIKHDTE